MGEVRGVYGWAQVPGTCGELAQGLIGDRFLHITCPIDAWVTASASLTAGSGRITGLDDRPKARRAVSRMLDEWNVTERFDVCVTLTNPLPLGKGLASSTADISACCFAVAQALGRDLSVNTLARIAIAVEPSDGLFYPGIAVFDHRKGSWGTTVGQPPVPPLFVLAYDLGGEVNTVEFNRRHDIIEANRQKESLVRQAFAQIIKGIRSGNPASIGAGATLSARANQEILHKEALEELIGGVSSLGTVGVNIAHSGTALGLLLPYKHRSRIESVIKWTESRFPKWTPLGSYQLVGGGPRYHEQSGEGWAI
ncbi:GHMP kinase [Heliobacillus mobilis]|uniref:GHMP kinase n=1 Tax=Heliobacterium mobile TaxID=28064 RepID=A0A6I3SMK7_HELMO|nr:GHMP kinase [Heliobacterium mobile]